MVPTQTNLSYIGLGWFMIGLALNLMLNQTKPNRPINTLVSVTNWNHENCSDQVAVKHECMAEKKKTIELLERTYQLISYVPS